MTLAGYKWRKGACAQYLDHRIGLKLCSKGSTPHWSGVVRNGESKLNARPEDVKQPITPHAKCSPLSVSKGSHSSLCFRYMDFTAGFCFHPSYRRLWLFSAPRQLGAYYYISAYIITVTRPGLLSACALNRMLRLMIGTRNRTLSLLWPKQR